MKVSWISDFGELGRLGARYDRLVDAAGDHGLFYERGWLERIWPAYQGQGARRMPLAFLWAEDQGRPVGLAPLQLEVKGCSALRLRRLCFLGQIDGPLANGVPDFLIPDPADRPACLQSFLDFLDRERPDAWDELDLQMLPERSPYPPLLARQFPQGRSAPEPLATPLVDLSAGFAAYRQRLPSKLRRELGRSWRGLQSQSCRCAFSVSAELTPARLAEVAEIHRRRQASLRARARRRSSIFENPAEAAILRELLEWAARNGRSRHYWLDVDGRLAAFVLCFHRGATLFPYLMAFDPAYEPFAPTKHLYLYLFEHEADLCATRTVNLLPGLNLLKRQFATQTVGHLRWSATNRRRLASRLRCRWTRLARALKANVVGPLASRLAGAPAIAAQRPLGRG